ncbi:MAG: 1-acyl-sn-glycerol-3-phosphate acyltransferase [Candidatus Obscuribacterales bacterium]|nr:1-acyl-sn-glycerol-3-phosphate acyltransferase [Steroidobacteraceae bacterium]
MRVFGWRVLPVPAPPPKAVVLVYPHTSNWDFPIGILARTVMQLRIGWVGKNTLFHWPFGALMRALGGTSIDRSHQQGMVSQLRTEFDRHATFYIVITPEGTRRHTEHWKSGFYHLARELEIPVGLTYIDYARREVAIAEWMRLSGDVEKDLAHIRDVYRGHQGRFPERMGEIRFKDR